MKGRDYLKMREEAQGLLEIDVDEEEFLSLWLLEGRTLEDAKLQLKWVKGLGSRVRIGDKMVGIKNV
jgi:hypothetical protein